MRAAVIGGGISGLAAARRLALAGHIVTLFEADATVGGLIKQVDLGGISVDIGAEAFATTRPETLNLIEDLGLGRRVASPSQAEARIRSVDAFGDPSLSRIPRGLLGIPADLSDPILTETLGSLEVAAAIVRDSKPWQLESPGTLGALVEERLGKVILDRFVAPVVAGVHSSDPRLLEVEVVAPGLFQKAKELGSLSRAAAAIRANAARPGSAVASLRGGMITLVQGLSASLGALAVDVRSGTAVTSIEPKGESFLLHSGALEASQSGRSGAEVFDLVVVAVPAGVAARLLSSFSDLSTHLARVRMVSVTVVAIRANSATVPAAPYGSGVLLAAGDSLVKAKACTHSSAKWDFVNQDLEPEGHIFRLSYGRDGVAPAPDELLLATARSDANQLFGFKPEEITAMAAHRWQGGLVQSGVGHRELIQAIEKEISKIPNLAVVSAGLGGNGITGALARVNQQLIGIGA